MTASAPTSADLLEALSSEAKACLARTQQWIEPVPPDAEGLMARVQEAAGNAWLAEQRAGFDGNAHEQPAADLARVERELRELFQDMGQ